MNIGTCWRRIIDTGFRRRAKPNSNLAIRNELRCCKKRPKESKLRDASRHVAARNSRWHMNKRIFFFASSAVVAADLILWLVLRLSSAAHNDGVLSLLLQTILAILGLPVRLYVIYVLGESGSWGIFGVPILIALLLISGMLWGFVIERACCSFQRSRATRL